MNLISKFSLGAAAVGSIAVPAGAVTTLTLNISNQAGITPITIGGNSIAQYTYTSQGVPNLKGGGYLFYTASLIGANNSMGNIASVNGPVALPDINGLFDRNRTDLGQSNTDANARYVPLKFQINGVDAVGNAFVTGTGGLEKIEYDTVGGVPEPAIWAELVAGFALAGAAMRRRRPQTALAA